MECKTKDNLKYNCNFVRSIKHNPNDRKHNLYNDKAISF